MSLDNKKYVDDLIYWSKRLYEKGMSPAKSGNISIRCNDGIYISSSGSALGDLTEEDIVLIDYNGNQKQGTKKPSSEKIMHTEIYTLRDDINAIIHCHCPLITAFAVAGLPIKKPILPDFVVLFDEVPIIPYYCPSSIELAEVVGKTFKDYSAVLLKNHGVVIGAKDIKTAYYNVEALRSYVETYFGAEVLGGAHAIPKKSVLEIKRLFLN